MSEWKKVRLGEICDYVTSGGTPLASRNDYYNPPVIPWLKTKEVNYSRITKTENFISQKGLDNSSAKLIPENSVIVAMYGQGDTAGRVAINKIPLTTNQACCNFIIDKEKADYNFIYYQLCTLYDKMVSLKSGGAQPNLNAGKLKELEIALPPLETQQKIAGILSAYDDLIENNRKQIKLLEEATQKLYKEWFVKLNFPGHENVKIVDGVPEGWKFERIDSFIELLNGFAFKSDSFDDEGKYGIITIKNVQDGAFDSANVNRVKEVPSKMPDWCNLEIGDILLSLTGNVGRVCLVTSENCLLNQRVAKLKSEYPVYTYTLFRSKDMFIMMNNLANGAAQQNLSPIRTGEQKILKPTQEVISAFENLVSPYIKKELSLFIQIQLLQSARDKLLPKLMNGEYV